MKVKDVPQDLKYFKGTLVRDLNYAIDEKGDYQAVRSDGWSVKSDALEITLEAIDQECAQILERIKCGESSPLEYYAVKNLMTIDLLSKYTGFSKRKIRKHYKSKYFTLLSHSELEIYANTLRISVEQLKTIPE